jgi:hypothetical protein
MSRMKIVDLSVVKHLEEARARVARGWCPYIQILVKDGVNHHCALGALNYDDKGVPRYNNNPPGLDIMIEIAKKRSEYKYYDGTVVLCHWNNRSDQKEVLAGFDEGIELARVRAYGGVEA